VVAPDFIVPVKQERLVNLPVRREALARQPREYRTIFLFWLIVVSALPALVYVLTFEVTAEAVWLLVVLTVLITILASVHQFVTIVYYLDRRWFAFFCRRPIVFFLVPLLILLSCLGLIMQPNSALAFGMLLGGVSIANLWHHSKQNWGIISLVGKTRRADVATLRQPLIYAWPFFVGAYFISIPWVRETGSAYAINTGTWITVNWVLGVVYCAGILSYLYLKRRSLPRDPIVLAFAAVLLCYFVPLMC
jgi:hypothetical protein